jgi:hypothetical protein
MNGFNFAKFIFQQPVFEKKTVTSISKYQTGLLPTLPDTFNLANRTFQKNGCWFFIYSIVNKLSALKNYCVINLCIKLLIAPLLTLKMVLAAGLIVSQLVDLDKS